jgi:hypothetical protein
MPSPFPGMDPYLEDPSVWEEFHHVFITECMYHLSDRLPEGYIAKIDERVELVSADDEAARQYIPDVAVAAMRGGRGAARAAVPADTATAVAVAPVTLASVDSLEVKEAYIEIVRLPEHDLVTSVELLSPWNKFGEGVGQYRSKRRHLVRHGIHVVEIDLLTRGRRTEVVGAVPTGDYFVFVFRGDRKPDVDVYPWGVRQPLPVVRVPLRGPDGDVPLELSAVITSAYDRGRYSRKLRYGAPPTASLSPADKTWAADVVKSVRD